MLPSLVLEGSKQVYEPGEYGAQGERIKTMLFGLRPRHFTHIHAFISEQVQVALSTAALTTR